MKTKIAFLVAAASLFALGPWASRLGAASGAIGALVLVATGVVLAWSASESVTALGTAAGAAGAFANGVLATVSPPVAMAAFVALVFAERTWRVRSTTARLVHLGGALVAGALAGALSSAYASAPPAVRGVAIVVAAVLLALPLLVDADDPVAHALDLAARDVGRGAACDALHAGAELRRHASVALLLDAASDEASRARATWKSLLRLAEARVRLAASAAHIEPTVTGTPTDAVAALLDGRIRDHVTALTRAVAGVDAARAAAVGVDDAALKSVQMIGESLEHVSRALLEQEAEQEAEREPEQGRGGRAS